MKKTIQRLCALLLISVLLVPGLPLQLSAAAEENTGTPGTGAAAALSGEDTGIIDGEALKEWMDAYVQQNKLDGSNKVFSVGFCYTATGDCWYYNADVFMYSASLYKVPVSMLMAEREASGELTPESMILGSTLERLENTALVYSNNESGHAMVDWLGGTYDGKCSDMTIPYTELPDSYFEQDFYDYSYYTARYMTQVLRTLYEGGNERFPHVIDYMLTAQPDEYFNISLKGLYNVAQKYGAFTEVSGNDNNHCAAIIYTPTPIIVTVMTRNIGEYQKWISEVGAYLAAYSLQLDGALTEHRRAQEAEEQARRAEEEAALAAEAAAAAAAETTGTLPQPVDTTAASEAPAAPATAEQPEGKRPFPIMSILIGLIALVLLAIIAVLLLGRRGRKENTGEWRERLQAKSWSMTEEEETAEETEKAEQPLQQRENRGQQPEKRSSDYRPRH